MKKYHTTHTAKGKCVREVDSKNMVTLDSSDGPAFFHFEDAAFIQTMEPVLVNSKCVSSGSKDDTFGFDGDKVTVWARGGCKGTFHVDFLIAYCTNGLELNSDNKAKYATKQLTSPCYTDGAAYSMTVDEELSDNKCGEYDNVHTGIGNKYGFYKTEIWADSGCHAKFTVCEVGTKLDKKSIMEMDMMHEMQHMEHMGNMGNMDNMKDEMNKMEHMPMDKMMDMKNMDSMKSMEKKMKDMENMDDMMGMKDMNNMKAMEKEMSDMENKMDNMMGKKNMDKMNAMEKEMKDMESMDKKMGMKDMDNMKEMEKEMKKMENDMDSMKGMKNMDKMMAMEKEMKDMEDMENNMMNM